MVVLWSAEVTQLKANRTDAVTIRLTPEQKAKIVEYAKEDGRSISGIIRKIIIYYINYREAR